MDMVLDTAVKYNDIFLSGVKITIIISLLSCFFGLLLGIILAFMKISGIKVLQWISTAYVEVIRGTPVLVQISLVFFGLPFLGIHFPSFQIMGVDFERLSAGVLALILNSGAYECEIVRSGIQSIPKGQLEGAMSLGFSKWESMVRIIIPQAIRNILPSVGNELIVNIKDSSVLNVISVSVLFFQAKSAAGAYYRYFEVYFIIAVIYLILTLTVSRVLRWVERRMDGPDNYVIHGSQSDSRAEIVVPVENAQEVEKRWNQ